MTQEASALPISITRAAAETAVLSLAAATDGRLPWLGAARPSGRPLRDCTAQPAASSAPEGGGEVCHSARQGKAYLPRQRTRDTRFLRGPRPDPPLFHADVNPPTPHPGRAAAGTKPRVKVKWAAGLARLALAARWAYRAIAPSRHRGPGPLPAPRSARSTQSGRRWK